MLLYRPRDFPGIRAGNRIWSWASRRRLPLPGGGLLANARPRLLFIRYIIRHVDDPDAAVFRAKRIVFVLELGLAVADGHQIRGRYPIVLNEEALDRVRAPLRELLIEHVATLGIRVTFDEKGATLQDLTRASPRSGPSLGPLR